MVRKKKTLQMLTFKDAFVFGTTLIEDPECCKGIIELATGISVERIEVSMEESKIYHPEYKSVRLDVYAKDEKHTHYNIEMQTVTKPKLGRRSRYYHSQMDMSMLRTGQDYKELPDTIVIFICDFDPFEFEKYRYTFGKRCSEAEDADLDDGELTIFLSTHGKNEDEVPKELVAFLKYVKADLKESTADFEDEFVKHLQNTVRSVKASREKEGHYMLLEEMIRDERQEEKKLINELNRRLLQDNRLDDLRRAIDDEEFCEKLYDEYHLEEWLESGE